MIFQCILVTVLHVTWSIVCSVVVAVLPWQVISLVQCCCVTGTVTQLETAIDTTAHHVAISTHLPPIWLAIPFVILLLMIATGPLLYPKFWHRYYPQVAMILAVLVMAYYVGVLRDFSSPITGLMEYLQFIALITALYMVSGGILIEVGSQATPRTNLMVLWLGAIIANLIGTTGASMLLVRPYLSLNQARIRVYHVVFFIFMVSNVGGALTPIGDPPLFLGFLHGVPFFWTLWHHWLPWLMAMSLLSVVFYYLDVRHIRSSGKVSASMAGSAFRLVGKRHFVWFAIIIVAVFIDPHVLGWVPALRYGHHKFSFVRELLLLGVAALSYRCAAPYALKKNEFSLAPLKEVVLIFIGIFGTMTPALQLISAYAASEIGQAFINHNTLYWGTGLCSSVLDNAPTYLNFSAASMAAQGAKITDIADVRAFAAGSVSAKSVLQLRAVSLASVFFGAMTYIGNGPNFMVKAIAEHKGLCMPSFFAYVLRFSVPILLPILVTVWLWFFAFA